MALYQPPDNETVILELRPWISGFVLKEYGHVDHSDQGDLAQEGCLRLIEIVSDLGRKPLRFRNKEEYVFYVKACVRNSVRDYILKLRSRFDISLYKLRRQLRENDQELGDFMTTVGDDFAHLVDEEAEDPREWQARQRRLSLLSSVRKSGRGMDVKECQESLGKVLIEYKRHLVEEGRWNFQTTSPRIAPITPEQVGAATQHLPHARTPLESKAISVERIVKCANRFCTIDLREVKVPLVYRGYGYCSKSCRKEWPPIVIKLQSQFDAPIEVILEVALKLFKSKRRTAEILNIASSTMERLVSRFDIGD